MTTLDGGALLRRKGLSVPPPPFGREWHTFAVKAGE